jgi:autotransporter-associated beta strand protein
LSGNVNFGGTGRWDIRGTGAALSTGGQSYSLTKVGTNQISLVGTTVDPALGSIAVNQGILSFQTNTSGMGDSTKTLTILSTGILGLNNATVALNKIARIMGGTIWAESGTGTQNTFTGPITLVGSGIFDAGSALTGGTPNSSAVLNLTGAIGSSGSINKNGPGTVVLSGPNTYTGTTTINGGTLSVTGDGNLGSAAGRVIFNGGKLSATGNVTMSRPITVNATGGGIGTAGNVVALTGAQSTTWGAGTFTVDGSTDGKLQFNRTGGTVAVDPAAILQINAGAVVELTGVTATSDGADFLRIVNNSTNSLLISGGNQIVGDISGIGSTVILNGASLTATSITQNKLRINAGSKLTIALNADGPLAGTFVPVPEPGTIVMMVMAGLAGCVIGFRRLKI